MIDPSRVQILNDAPIVAGDYVLYWMQASQRTKWNPALEYGIGRANELRLPLVVGFGLMDDYPEANARHYRFMLEGLRDVRAALASRNVAFVIRRGAPASIALILAERAALVVCDRGYLRHQRRWRDELTDAAGRQVVQVEGDVVVPIEVASDKAEFAARTIRPRIQRLLNRYLKPFRSIAVLHSSDRLSFKSDMDVSDPSAALAKLKLDRSVPCSKRFIGGEVAAGTLLNRFVRQRLTGYATNRREPSVEGSSLLAAYLHFGQISPVQIAAAVQRATAPDDDKTAFLEELIVRRELAMNYVYFQPAYDQFAALPAWAKQTLEAHQKDGRPYLYTRRQLERAQTHDPYWNAAQREMTLTGYMHNAMRMYWGKKMLEWKGTPEEAFADLLYLNNKYFMCGRDPVSYANVAWIFGLHDRPWGSRSIFGTVRYMNAAGLERKFNMDAYVAKVARMESRIAE